MNIITKGFVYAILAAACWGVVYVLHQVALTKISPLKLLFYGGLLDIAILAPVIYYRGEKFIDNSLADARICLFIIGAVLVAMVANFFILFSIQKLGASTAAVLEISYPVFTALVLFLFLGEKLDWRFMIGASFVFVGVCIIVLRKTSDLEQVKNKDTQLAFSSAGLVNNTHAPETSYERGVLSLKISKTQICHSGDSLFF